MAVDATDSAAEVEVGAVVRMGYGEPVEERVVIVQHHATDGLIVATVEDLTQQDGAEWVAHRAISSIEVLAEDTPVVRHLRAVGIRRHAAAVEHDSVMSILDGCWRERRLVALQDDEDTTEELTVGRVLGFSPTLAAFTRVAPAGSEDDEPQYREVAELWRVQWGCSYLAALEVLLGLDGGGRVGESGALVEVTVDEVEVGDVVDISWGEPVVDVTAVVQHRARDGLVVADLHDLTQAGGTAWIASSAISSLGRRPVDGPDVRYLRAVGVRRDPAAVVHDAAAAIVDACRVDRSLVWFQDVSTGSEVALVGRVVERTEDEVVFTDVDEHGRRSSDLNRMRLDDLRCVRWGGDTYLRALEVLSTLDDDCDGAGTDGRPPDDEA